LLVAVLVVASSLSVAVVGTTAAEPVTFHVTQGDECYEVTPIGSGDRTVEEFYDYRTPDTSPAAYTYSSHGTTELQANQVSNLFVYHGARGFSLVMLHDQLGNSPHGGTITFEITGLPSDWEWAVEDDSYRNPDDNFDHRETSSVIDWMWAPDRTDGAAVRGLGGDDYDHVTIEPRFNEEAAAWGDWPYSGGDHQVRSWRLLGEGGTTVERLEKDQRVAIAKGPCPDRTPPTVSAFDVRNPSDETIEVSFEASEPIVDVLVTVTDEDGNVVASLTRTDFDASGGTYTATVTPGESGRFTATLVTAKDAAGNDGANGQSDAVTLDGGAPPALPNATAPPRDVDGDGLYEDVNGDGAFDVVDVQALFVGLDSDAVRNHPDEFDFNGDGTVNVVDVQRLFRELRSR
jgi:hypothetical protein